ncbi:Ig-like domain-containing protein [Syntrophus aciditrophicus]|nr:Ig-like domain-containing protein [Syntrophus aciditrophicus]
MKATRYFLAVLAALFAFSGFFAPAVLAAETVTAVLERITLTSEFSPPSPDPAGIVYLSDYNTLLISDCEVDEMPPYFTGKNLFEATLGGSLLGTLTTTSFSDEPTGVAYDPSTRRLFVSDDNKGRIWIVKPGDDGVYNTEDDVLTNFRTSSFGIVDPEDVVFDSWRDHLVVIDGTGEEVWDISPGANGVFDGASGDDQASHFDTEAMGIHDPEGIAFDTNNGHLYLLSSKCDRIAETTISGTLIRYIDISRLKSSYAASMCAGLTYAPSSSTSGKMNLYMVTRGVDNGADPYENDGRIYEISFPPLEPSDNLAPVVNAGADQTITFPGSAALAGTASDDGLPSPPATLTYSWSKVSGPGTVTFGSASSLATTASFSAAGTYTLRLTVSDSALSSSDDIVVTVNDSGGTEPQSFSVRVSAGSDDAEEFTASNGWIYLTGNDLELIHDSEDQIVGMRFNSIPVPAGATILDARVQFTVKDATTGVCSLVIRGEAADHATTFTTTRYNISSRLLTSAAVNWTPAAWTAVGAAGPDQQTPNLSSILQEIVSRPGWQSGNSLALIVTGSGTRTASAYERSASQAPQLLVTYSTSSQPTNQMPVANAQSVSTAENMAKAITLTGSDPDGDSLIYSVVTAPAHGTLSGTAPNLTYTPSFNYSGSDSFTFKVNDGTADSAPATVSITVTEAANNPPVANAQSVSTAENTAKAITLTASDPDGDSLTYVVVTAPSHGTLSGTAPDLTYTPASGYSGLDSFTFKVNDGTVDSASATVSITVTAVNDAPVANAQSVSTAEDTAKAITLTGSDPDGDSLTYSVVTSPSHGTLSGTAPDLIYTPASNYSGSDSFTFKVNDGTVDSSPATVSITITAVNDAPVANPQSVTTPANMSTTITLTGSDPDGDKLTYNVVSGPTQGTLSGSAPNLIYTPASPYYVGPDSFTFTVNDGMIGSTPATVSITITAPVNSAPIVNAGIDQTIILSASAYLNGSATDDGLPNPPAMLTYTWSKVTGPGTVTFENTSSPVTTATFSKGGGYTLRLTVSDGDLSSSDDIAVNVRRK